MSYIFFIYGLSFFMMGFALVLYPTKESQYKLAKHIWLMGVFGILHGLSEWIEMFTLIESSKPFLIQVINLLLMAFSYIFLLCFALKMLSERLGKLSSYYPVVIILPLVAVVVSCMYFSADPFVTGNIYSRYLIAIPATFLTAYAFYLEVHCPRVYKKRRVLDALKVLVAAFVVYGALSGLIVPDAQGILTSWLNYSSFETITGMPIQLARAVTALIATSAVLELLKMFRDEAEVKLMKLAITDSLTGVYNRTKFDAEFSNEFERAKRYKHPLCIVILDIDHFKKVNDTYGHVEGDKVLRKIAKITKSITRENDIFARWGGEEFIILLPESNVEDAKEFADRLRFKIQTSDFEKAKGLTASFGVSHYLEGESGSDFIKRADSALYKAKEQGRNRVITL